nr:post-GPI attachment to proteins factor 2-like isoform X1 [Leptinotarsa decemlineata]
MTSELKHGEERFTVHYSLQFKRACLISVSLPLSALIICFFTAYAFQYNDIQETHCRVFNVIPSISAVTGITPQTYLWRISIVFHILPRLIISAVHRSYLLGLMNVLAQPEIQSKAHFWLNAAFSLNAIETGALCGVTYISNRENYAVHEKLFIIFIISSLTHMLACIKGVNIMAELKNGTNDVLRHIQLKKKLFKISISSTIGLVVFFLQHRLFCHRLANIFFSAFSMFAFCEYIIAFANIGFHIAVILDLPTESFLVANRLTDCPLEETRKQK